LRIVYSFFLRDRAAPEFHAERKDRQLVQMEYSSLGTTEYSALGTNSKERCLISIFASVLDKLTHDSVGIVQEASEGFEMERVRS
jgi:hypothetical protein